MIFQIEVNEGQSDPLPCPMRDGVDLVLVVRVVSGVVWRHEDATVRAGSCSRPRDHLPPGQLEARLGHGAVRMEDNQDGVGTGGEGRNSRYAAFLGHQLSSISICRPDIVVSAGRVPLEVQPLEGHLYHLPRSSGQSEGSVLVVRVVGRVVGGLNCPARDIWKRRFQRIFKGIL